jgi:hypothetical protein
LVQGQINTGAEPEGTPANNRCVNAFPIEVNAMASGTVEGGLFDFSNQAACGVRSDLPSVWYAVLGTGEPLTVGLCASSAMQIDFAIIDLCNSPTDGCFGFPTESRFAQCQNDEYATYTFNTEDGVDYWVHVRGESPAEFDILLKEGVRTDENFLDDATFVNGNNGDGANDDGADGANGDGAMSLALTGAIAATAGVMSMMLI